jgi:hypothetical protein
MRNSGCAGSTALDSIISTERLRAMARSSAAAKLLPLSAATATALSFGLYRRAAVGVILRDMWRAAAFTTTGDEVGRVIILVATHSAAGLSIVVDHVQRGRALAAPFRQRFAAAALADRSSGSECAP